MYCHTEKVLRFRFSTKELDKMDSEPVIQECYFSCSVLMRTLGSKVKNFSNKFLIDLEKD